MLEGQGESGDTMENKHQSRQSSVPPKGPANDGRKGEKMFQISLLLVELKHSSEFKSSDFKLQIINPKIGNGRRNKVSIAVMYKVSVFFCCH